MKCKQHILSSWTPEPNGSAAIFFHGPLCIAASISLGELRTSGCGRSADKMLYQHSPEDGKMDSSWAFGDSETRLWTSRPCHFINSCDQFNGCRIFSCRSSPEVAHGLSYMLQPNSCNHFAGAFLRLDSKDHLFVRPFLWWFEMYRGPSFDVEGDPWILTIPYNVIRSS